MNTAANSRIRFGSSETSGNLVSMQWTYVSADSLTNKFSLDFYGRSNQMAFFNSGNMSLGRASPYAMFDIAGSSNFVTGTYNKMLACFGSNASPVQFDIQCSTATSGKLIFVCFKFPLKYTDSVYSKLIHSIQRICRVLHFYSAYSVNMPSLTRRIH